MLKTFDGIVTHIISILTDSDKAKAKEFPRNELISLHHTFGRSIRNEYGLWDANHPLTKSWHELRSAGSEEQIVDGIDFHPNHPDSVSQRIIERVWELLQK